MARISIDQVSKHFGDHEVVSDVSLEIADGSFTVIVGASGSGKTTLLRAIAGLEGISSGRIVIGERDVTQAEARHRDVAFVFQNYALYGHLTVRQNIAFPLRARKVPRAEIDARVERAAALLGLEELLERRPRALSGGQQQRVAIGRAIVREPSAFLFDEPLSNLDARLRLEMRREIIRLQAALGTTAVWVTHDQEEAMAMADQIVVIDRGVIAQVGAPGDVYDAPATVHVAKTIGSPTMNLFEGEVRDGRFHGDLSVAVGEPHPRGRVILGVRPDELRVATGDERDAVVFAGTAEVRELLGPRVILTVRCGETRVTAVCEHASVADLEEGAPVSLAAPAGRLHWFDPATQARCAATADAGSGPPAITTAT